MSVYEHFSETELEILRIRAERAANSARKSSDETHSTALQTMLGDESYALPIELIRTVYEGVTVVPVPSVPPFVAGIANVRGRILPVLDLTELMGIKVSASSNGSAAANNIMIVAGNGTVTVAFSVRSVGEVITYSTSDIMVGSTSAEVTESRYLRGVLSDGTGLLDLAALLSDPDLIVVEAS